MEAELSRRESWLPTRREALGQETFREAGLSRGESRLPKNKAALGKETAREKPDCLVEKTGCRTTRRT